MSYDFDTTGQSGLIAAVVNDWALSDAVTLTLTDFIQSTLTTDGQVRAEVYGAADDGTTIPEGIQVARIEAGGVYDTSGQDILVHVDTDEPVTINVAPGGSVIVIGGGGDDALRFVNIVSEELGTLSDGPAGGRAVLMEGGLGDDSIGGSVSDDSLMGGDGDDTLMGDAGDDTLIGGAGDDSIDGSAGFDEAMIGGESRSGYMVTVEDGDLILTASAGGETDRLSATEFVTFEDGTAMIGLADQDQGDIARLYEIVLDREADAAGLQFWLRVFESGFSLDEISQAFVQSEEFRTILEAPTDREFLEAIYEQGYGREGDEAGLDFWEGALGTGLITRAQMVSLFASSDEAIDIFDYIKLIDDSDLG